MKQLFEIKIEKLAMGGFGIGYWENKAIFVPYTAPGDVVDIHITHERKDHSFAKVSRYLSRGEAFVSPMCEAFAAEVPCGGCDWLMLDYKAQVEAKASLIEGLFSHFVDREKIYPTLASPMPRHYRNKVFMPVGKNAVTRKPEYGIYSRWTHKIVSHSACVNHPHVFDAIATRIAEICDKSKIEPYDENRHSGNLRHIGLRCSADMKEILVILFTLSGKLPFSGLLVKQLTSEFPAIVGIVQNINREKGNVIYGNETKVLYGQDYLSDTLSNTRFRINYRSFWQINIGTMENIMASIRSVIKPDSKVLDAFCGIGAIGLSLAGQVKALTLLEELPEAIEDARLNAELNGIDNVSFITGKFEDALSELVTSNCPDCLIMDPPRSGATKESIETIIQSGIKQLVYVSCSPMTLARDLRLLINSGKYELQSLQSFDMFPNTWHIECLAVLNRI